jgi:anti-anti-sigma factor
MALQTTIEQVDGPVPVTIVRLDGELDASNFEALIDEVRGLYDAGTRQLLLDMTDLRFMASSGLVALHSIVRIMHGQRSLDTEAGWSALTADTSASTSRTASGGAVPPRNATHPAGSVSIKSLLAASKGLLTSRPQRM